MRKSTMWTVRAVYIGCFSCAAAMSHAALQPVSEAPLAAQYQQFCRLNRNGSTECTYEVHTKVLKTAGREWVSKFEFDYPDTDRFEVLKAEIIDSNGKKISLPRSNIETREAPQPAGGFARDKRTSFFFPKIEVGSTLIYKVRQHYAAKPLIDQASWQHFISPRPTRYDRYVLTFTSEQPLVWRGEALDDFNVTLSADKKRLTVEQKAPRYVNYVNEPENSRIRRIPYITVGASDQVQDYLGALERRYNQILKAPLPSAAASAVRAVKGKAPAEQAAGLMEYIYTHYRYLGDWRPSARGYIPFSLAEIETHGYGDCKDLSVLLTAMLRSAGIQAEPAFVERGLFAYPLLLPIPSAANHAIVRAQVGDQVWWLDPTNPYFAPGYTMPDIQARWAWVVRQDGQIQQTHIPAEGPEKNVARSRSLKRFKADGSADIKVQGNLDPYWMTYLINADQQQGVEGANQALFCKAIGIEPINCIVKRAATAFRIPDQYPFTVTALDQRAVEKVSGQFVYEARGSKEPWTFFDTYLRDRALSDLYLGAADKTERRVQLKNAWPDQSFKPCKVRSQWFDIDLEWTPEADGLTYIYRQVQKVSWLSHDEIVSAAFKKMNEEARQCAKQLRFAVRLDKEGKKHSNAPKAR